MLKELNEEEKKKLRKEYKKIHYSLYAPKYQIGNQLRPQPTEEERKKLIVRLRYLQDKIFKLTNTIIQITY